MRRLFSTSLLSCVLAGCHCGHDLATPVTLRVKNNSADPLFVNDTSDALGMEVQRKDSGQFRTFPENPPCPCLSCDQVCRGCNCAEQAPPPMVLKILAGESRERIWSGVMQVSANASCSSSLLQGPPCFKQDVPSLDEVLQVHFCYSPSAPGIVVSDGGTPVPGVLPPASIVCSDKQFRVVDGVVEVSPKRGASCTQHSECTGAGELCFGGACTTTCPQNNYPAVGASWQVRVAEPNDQGFFTVTTDGIRKTYLGTGMVGSVSFTGGSTIIQMRRGSPGPVGTVYYALPPRTDVPISPGETLTVKVVDASSSDNQENRAIVLRDQQQNLLLAADSAQQFAILTSADTVPFTVSTGVNIVGCEYSVTCGKKLFYKTVFAGGPTPVELEPGKSAQLISGAFQFLNVSNSDFMVTTCSPKKLMPYVITSCRGGPCPLTATP